MKTSVTVYSLLLTLFIASAYAAAQTIPTQNSISSQSSSAVAVKVEPNSATLASSQTLQFTALVSNTSKVGVRWTASQGVISKSGLYRAPNVSTNISVTVTATSVQNPTKSETATILVTPRQTSSRPQAQGQASRAIKQSFFGSDFNGARVWPPTDGQHQIASLGGLRLWDDGVKWGQINTAPGVYDWAGIDAWMSRAQAQHVDVLYTFGDTPQFAGSIPPGNPCVAPSSYSCSAPNDVNKDGTGTDAKFIAFVTALVDRYKGQIAFYELWNEADCTCFFAGTQAQLVRMGKDAASIIRSHDPAAKILSPSAHGPTMSTFFKNYIAAGGAANFDIVDVHMRGAASANANPEAFLTVYGQVTSQLTANKLTTLPIWDGEHGIKKNELTDPDELAGFVARGLALRAGVGLQRQYIYTWDAPAPYGLQGNESGTAWDVVAGWLIGHSINPCVASGTVYSCDVDNGQIVWDTAQSCKQGSCTTSKYTYPSTYAWESDLTGKKTALSGKTVAIGYKPIFLTAK